MQQQNVIFYARVKYWADHYGNSGAEDKKAVEDYVTCEATEAVVSLRSELISISRGQFEDRSLDILVGVKRKAKFGTYDVWAKTMLLWLASAKP